VSQEPQERRRVEPAGLPEAQHERRMAERTARRASRDGTRQAARRDGHRVGRRRPRVTDPADAMLGRNAEHDVAHRRPQMQMLMGVEMADGKSVRRDRLYLRRELSCQFRAIETHRRRAPDELSPRARDLVSSRGSGSLARKATAGLPPPPPGERRFPAREHREATGTRARTRVRRPAPTCSIRFPRDVRAGSRAKRRE
jgi:hypothetical protein